MLRTLRKATIALAAAGTLAAVAAPAADALVRTGTIYAQDGRSAATWRYDSYTGRTTGTLYDLSASDRQCARLYSQGYNIVLGWGGWNLEKTVCGGGRDNYSHTPRVYSDKIDLIVCTGYDQCVRQRIKG